jgi:hypothetical protein
MEKTRNKNKRKRVDIDMIFTNECDIIINWRYKSIIVRNNDTNTFQKIK